MRRMTEMAICAVTRAPRSQPRAGPTVRAGPRHSVFGAPQGGEESEQDAGETGRTRR